MEMAILNIEGKEVEKIKLSEKMENFRISTPLLHEVVTAYLANQRQGTASTKTRGEVRGGGRKPWRQKHTGRARHGSIRSPIWRGGGVVFGPKPRSYRINLPKKKKRIALKMAIVSKLRDNELILVDSLKPETHKTKEFKKIAQNLSIPEGSLIVVNPEEMDMNLKLASRNLRITVKKLKDINTYEVLKAKKVIFTKNAFENFQQLSNFS